MGQNTDKTATGQLLREMRERAGLSRNGLAALTGFDATHLYRIEVGSKRPRSSTVEALVAGIARAMDSTAAEQSAAYGKGTRPSRIERGQWRFSPIGSRALQLPNRVSLSPMIADLRRLLNESRDANGGFREAGAPILADSCRLDFTRLSLGDESSVDIAFDPLIHLGTAHTHPNGGLVLPPSEADIETAAQEGERLTIVVSGETLWGLILLRSNHIEIPNISREYEHAFVDSAIGNHRRPDRVLPEALIAAAFRSSRLAGYHLYRGSISDGLIEKLSFERSL